MISKVKVTDTFVLFPPQGDPIFQYMVGKVAKNDLSRIFDHSELKTTPTLDLFVSQYIQRFTSEEISEEVFVKIGNAHNDMRLPYCIYENGKIQLSPFVKDHLPTSDVASFELYINEVYQMAFQEICDHRGRYQSWITNYLAPIFSKNAIGLNKFEQTKALVGAVACQCIHGKYCLTALPTSPHLAQLFSAIINFINNSACLVLFITDQLNSNLIDDLETLREKRKDEFDLPWSTYKKSDKIQAINKLIDYLQGRPIIPFTPTDLGALKDGRTMEVIQHYKHLPAVFELLLSQDERRASVSYPTFTL